MERDPNGTFPAVKSYLLVKQQRTYGIDGVMRQFRNELRAYPYVMSKLLGGKLCCQRYTRGGGRGEPDEDGS